MPVCEPVLTEVACFLRDNGSKLLMTRYPRMIWPTPVWRRCRSSIGCQVLTVGRRDFNSYRRNDRQIIGFLAPPA